MSVPYRKKLIEVALPLEAINAACKKDKDRKTSTIRSIHKWFARMPVPALRALLFAALVDDPDNDSERVRLHRLIEDLVASGTDDPPAAVLAEARKLIEQAVGAVPPIVLDPFCGGGSTLVEAQRLNLPARGSDLNPIPVLITKALTELPPTVYGRAPLHGDGMLEAGPGEGLSGFLSDVRHYANRVRAEVFTRIGHLYPAGPNGETVSAWIWARTVESPDPRYRGVHVPLVNNWWLSKRSGARAYIQPVIDRDRAAVAFEIRSDGEPPPPSKNQCLLSGSPISFKYIRARGLEDALGTRMLAVVTSGRGARYHVADAIQVDAAEAASPTGLFERALPPSALGFRVQGYGMRTWSQLFTRRQQVSLAAFADAIRDVPRWVIEDGGDEGLAIAIATVLGLAVGKLSQQSSSLCRWFIDGRNGAGGVLAAFGSHHLSMSWDFAETSPFGGSVGDWLQVVDSALGAFASVNAAGPRATVVQEDARRVSPQLAGRCLVVTDPPYFSAVGYANLADYFYPPIREALRDKYPDLLATIATPKDGELIAEPARHASDDDAKEYFIEGFTETFRGLKRASRPDLPLLIVYAFKEQEAAGGWEAMLEAVIGAELSIVGTWPVHGTGSARMRGFKSNALATYVVLVCRPRIASDMKASRREFVSELRSELGPAVRLLQAAAIAPVDLAQAAIGPGMAVFSRYSTVLEADGEPMSVRTALDRINQALEEILAEQEGDFDPETRFAVTWFEQRGTSEGPFGEGDALARAKNTSVEALEGAGIITSRAGKVRLKAREELAGSCVPATDPRLTVWEVTQQLIRRLDERGEDAAAGLLADVGGLGDTARELAYRLYTASERKGWTQEALAYNSLVVAWPEIARLVAEQPANAAQQALGV